MSSQLKCLAIALLIGASTAQADTLPTGWASARALGMGNAYTSVVDDSDAIFYNPAALTRIKGIHWEIADPHVGVDNPSNIQQLKSLSSSSGIASQINNLYGQNFWAGGGAKSAFTFPGVGLAAYANTSASILAMNPPNPSAKVDYYFDYGAAMSFAAELVPSVFSVGVTARYVNRTGANTTLGAATLAQSNTQALQASLENRGSGLGVDFGSELRLPGPISPALSFVYRDIGNTSFSHDSGPAAPPPTLSEMIAGGSVTLHVPFLSVTPSVDYRYINWSNVATGENVDVGLEVSLALIDLRGGVSQGYYTAGAGLDLGLIRADVATWAVELGAYPGQAVDRRYMAQLTIELGFDPGKYFGSSGSSSDGSSGSYTSGSHHLKQRR